MTLASSSFFINIFQISLHENTLFVVTPNYPEAKFRFQNTNFPVLLIIQFNKVLIISSPHTRVTYGTELSVIQKLLMFRAVVSSVKVTNTKQMWIVQASNNILNSVFSHWVTVFQHEYRRTKTEWIVGNAILFYYYSPQNGRNTI
jgi:hypothetical protein